MSELQNEEKAYYERCLEIYRELDGTKLSESLIDLREQTIARIARLDDEKLVWKELGKLYIIDVLVGKKKKVFDEIKRIESIIDE